MLIIQKRFQNMSPELTYLLPLIIHTVHCGGEEGVGGIWEGWGCVGGEKEKRGKK